jgi:hypothetical protein
LVARVNAFTDLKVRVVFLYLHKVRRADEIREAFGIPSATLGR